MATTKVDYTAKREALTKAYLKPKQKRPATSARGIHHLALISSDIERTIKFYSEVLGFPLVELFENRDLASSTHWFHDLGHGNLLAFFDFPEDPMPPTRESVGGMHHVSISVPRDQFDRIRGELDKRSIEYFGPDRVENSLYFKGPDGELLEIEATGDRLRAEKWFTKYGTMPEELKASLKAASDVPVDIDPVFSFPERVR